MRIDPGVRPAILAALLVAVAELGLFEAAAIFGAFATYVGRSAAMTAACLVVFGWIRRPLPSLRNLRVVPYLIRCVLFANTTVLLILAFSASPDLNHTYTIFMLHIGAAYIIARLPLPLKAPLTKSRLWDGPFALAILVLLAGIYLYHFVAAEPVRDPDVAAAGLWAALFAALSAVSYATSNIMATYFERENVRGVEGHALGALDLTYLGSLFALAVAPLIGVILQVQWPSAAPAPGSMALFAFWAIVAGTLSLPGNTLLFSAFSRTSNPALVSSMDALVLVFALVPDVLWHGMSLSSLIGTKGIGLVLILAGGIWATYRDARTS